MSKKYMNKVFWDTFKFNFREPESTEYIPKEFWQMSEKSLQGAKPVHRGGDNGGYFNQEEENILRMIGEKHGIVIKTDETGQLVTKEQEENNRKVKQIMIKAGLWKDENQLQEEKLAERVDKISTRSPYNTERQRVKYF